MLHCILAEEYFPSRVDNWWCIIICYI